MLDALSLDQLRVFVAIADNGSFSAAARELKRAQSAISNAVLNLESALGVALYDRSGWKPVLTPHGEALLTDARAVLLRTEQFKARAYSLTRGVEAELSMVFDVMYPVARLVDIVRRLRQAFPSVVVRLRTEVLGGVPDKVLSGECDLGVQGSLPEIDDALLSHRLPSIPLVPVSAPTYELAGETELTAETLRRHTQIVLSDNSGRTSNRTFSVFSNDRIMTGDLGSKQALLRAGLGWGYMPRHVVENDLAAASLVELDLHDKDLQSRGLPQFLIYRHAHPPGPAGQWVADQLLRADFQD
ncbi:LysR family transcriptional regulator [Robbsia sp. KACC 23696]|uniref:LysR family transcriptional regulator n=1 Tax=Robbsia sp. KACC 23696 TaxID=3149231 RepID=UPI00325BD44F